MIPRISLCAFVALATCGNVTPVSRNADPGLFTPTRATPENATAGSCWDKSETPAVVETVRENILIEPAKMSDTGTVQSPPVYETRSRQVIVQDRSVTWFEVICREKLTPEFVASVQRALELRGYYGGPITSQMDSVTRDAIARYQADRQIATLRPDALTTQAAREMGLWTAPQAQAPSS